MKAKYLCSGDDLVNVEVLTSIGSQYLQLPFGVNTDEILRKIKTWLDLDYSDVKEDPQLRPVDKELGERFLKCEKAASDKVGTGLVLIPWYSILEIGKIFIEGLRYGRDNWKRGVNDKEYQEERLEHAMLHLLKWKEGDRTEQHLAKIAWFCITQLELERMENGGNICNS